MMREFLKQWCFAGICNYHIFLRTLMFTWFTKLLARARIKFIWRSLEREGYRARNWKNRIHIWISALALEPAKVT